MRVWTFIRRSLAFYWRTHLGVLAGAAVATTILVGGLVIGDSVRYSLKRMAMARLREVQTALVMRDRFFAAPAEGEGSGLAGRMSDALGAPAAPVLQLPGSASADGGKVRLNRVEVLGVDARFWRLGGTDPVAPAEDEAVLNRRAAFRLGAEVGDLVLLRVEKPSALPRDAPMGSEADATVAFRVKVVAVADDQAFGRFSLRANQMPPDNVFVRLADLQGRVGLEGRANVLLVGGAGEGMMTAERADGALADVWTLDDAQLTVRAVPEQPLLELRSGRLFIDEAVARAAEGAGPRPIGVLTYFVNELRVGDRATPYSMVTALGPMTGAAETIVPADMADDEIILSTWTAADLGAEVGDELTLTYFVLAPMGRLQTASTRFRVRAVLDLSDPAWDSTLMPPFPGLAEQENCRDWEPGVPIDVKRIREKDEAYWDAHRGTPKAFVTLAAGQRMWSNRYGKLTAVRYPAEGPVEALRSTLKERLGPAPAGLFFRPVREQARRATQGQPVDFGQLFLGLSMFLLFAAVILMALLFAFGIEQRGEEVGTLLAVGLEPKRVRRMLLAEGTVLAAVGSAAGLAGGLAYTRLMLHLLSTVWAGAVGGTSLWFHASPVTVAVGTLSGIVVAVIAMALALRRQGRRPARELLAGGSALSTAAGGGRRRGVIAAGLGVLAFAGAGAMVAAALIMAGDAATGAFFGAGGLLLLGGLALGYALLVRLDVGAGRPLSVGRMGLRNATRRRGRSLATIALLACGSFMVVAVGANRKSALKDARGRASGTGGFALYAEATVPVYRDLNDPDVREDRNLDGPEMADVAFVPMRVREGDEASCLNLNRPQQPRLVGLPYGALSQRGAFRFASTLEGRAAEDPWQLLEWQPGDGPVPAIVDFATLKWSLAKELGETLEYVDGNGRPFKVRLVGALGASVLQGSVFISEDAFLAKYPSAGGYRMFLIDAPWDRRTEVARQLIRSLRAEGIDVVATTDRLAAFFNLENTYLSIFQLLGGLGMLLGSVGLGLVVLRNVLERRGELALMRAVGYGRRELAWLVLSEHWLLLGLGLVVGVLAALVAVAPTLAAAGADLPAVSLTVTLAAVLASGVVWTAGAAGWALKGPLMDALRNE